MNIFAVYPSNEPKVINVAQFFSIWEPFKLSSFSTFAHHMDMVQSSISFDSLNLKSHLKV